MGGKLARLVDLGRGLYADTASSRKLDRTRCKIQKLAKKLSDEQLLALLEHDHEFVRMAGCISLYDRCNSEIMPVLRELGSGEPIPWPDDPSQIQRVDGLNMLRMEAFTMLAALNGVLDEFALEAELAKLRE